MWLVSENENLLGYYSWSIDRNWTSVFLLNSLFLWSVNFPYIIDIHLLLLYTSLNPIYIVNFLSENQITKEFNIFLHWCRPFLKFRSVKDICIYYTNCFLLTVRGPVCQSQFPGAHMHKFVRFHINTHARRHRHACSCTRSLIVKAL